MRTRRILWLQRRTSAADRLVGEVDAISALREPERRRALHELEWKTTAGLRVSWVLARHTAAALPRELAHGVARLAGRYDTAIAQVDRLAASTTLQVGPTRPRSRRD